MRTKQLWCFLTAVLVLLLFSFASYGEGRPFITRWKGKAGEELRIPIYGRYYKLVIKKASDNTILKTEPSLTIGNWGAGAYKFTPTEDGELLVEAGSEGVSSISMNEGSAEALLRVEQFGTVEWQTMENAFRGCTNLQFAEGIDAPDLSEVSNMKLMFDNCTSFNQDLGMWKLEKCEELGLNNCGMSIENYSKSLEGWAAQANLKQGLSLSAKGLKYNANGRVARKLLKKNRNWHISGDIDEIGRPFITRWKGEAGKELRIPISGQDYRIVIKKASDGIVLKTDYAYSYASYSYIPTEDGELLVEAGPDGVSSFQTERGYGSSYGSAEALLRVEQFGTVEWTRLSFSGCKNIQFASDIDTPDLSMGTDMSRMFSDCTSFNQPLNNWDVSQVTNMNDMFSGCSTFNQSLDNWDVSKVTRMVSMFSGCTSFNQSLDNWDVSKVTYMNHMFSGCASFNQPLNDWNVSQVTDMSLMFKECTSFNQPLNNWDVSQVTDMDYMFSDCTSFNQPLNNWDVSQVTNMNDMFSGCSTFNQSLDNWDVSKVTRMVSMFSGCTSFNQSLDNWDVSKVTDMRDMFSGCSVFNQNLGMWKLEKCEYLGLDNCGMSVENYSKCLEGWAAQTTIMQYLHLGADGLIYNIRGKTARKKLVNNKNWRISGDTNESGRPFITRWKGKAGKKMKILISGSDYKLVIKKASDNTILITEPSLTSTPDKYYEYTPLEDGELLVEAGPDGVSSFRSYTNTDPEALLRVEQFGNVEWQSMLNAFLCCKNMQFAEGIDTPDLSKVKDMRGMFFGCTSFNHPLDHWDVSQVTDMRSMFSGCTSFNQPLNNWDVSMVQDMGSVSYAEREGMFAGCISFNQPLNNWNVSKVTDMESMFSGCTSFNQDLGMWKLEKCKRLGLDNCGMSVENYSKCLEGWATQTGIAQRLLLSARELKYNASGKAARKQLVESKKWSINGDIDENGRHFITRWKGEAGKNLCIPIYGDGYKLVIKKASDGSVLRTAYSNYLYNYTPSEDGELLVEAGPDGINSFQMVNEWQGSAEALLRVEQFGTVEWLTMRNAFRGCKNLQFVESIDTPDLRKVKDMSDMFSGCTSFNHPLNNWTVWNVTNMENMFSGCTSFNQPLNNWDVRWVITMENMFSGCSSFDQDLGMWKLENCGALGLDNCGMSVENYSKSLVGWGAQYDIKRDLLLNSEGLKYNASSKAARKKLISEKNWKIKGDRYENAKPFITRWKGEMGKDLQIPIQGKNCNFVIKKASDGSVLVTENNYSSSSYSSSYTYTPTEDGELLVEVEPEGVSSFLSYESDSAEALLRVEQFGTVEWQTMQNAFRGCTNMQFAEGIASPDLSQVTDMRYMFSGCASFNQPLNNWDVSKVTDMCDMFSGCTSFNQDLGMWKLRNCRELGLDNCGMSVENYSKSLVGWAAQEYINRGLILTIDGLRCNASGKAALKQLKEKKNWKIKASFITRWEGKARNQLTIPISGACTFVIRKAADGSVLKTDYHSSYFGAYTYTPTENGELLVEVKPDGVNSFRMADQYGRVQGSAEALLRVEQFGTVKWQTMENAFRGCENMQFAEGIDTPDLSQVSNMSGMFLGSTSFNQSLNNWDVSQISDMSGMFAGCTSFNQSLNDWDVSKVEDMSNMFSGCTSFNQDLGMWKLEKCEKLGLDNCGMSVENYSKSLEGWATQIDINERLQLNATGLKFFPESTKPRAKLINSKYWRITGDNLLRYHISFESKMLTLTKGVEHTLVLIKKGIDASETVTLTSSDPNIVQIIDAAFLTIKGLKEGTVTITATVAANSNHETLNATCEVMVRVAVTGVSLSKTGLPLVKGATEMLIATVSPSDATNKKVIWSSNNSSLATVENGQVTALSAGNATITVTTEDGNHTATCKVVVTDPIPASGVTLSQTELSLLKGATATLVATVVPSEATNKRVTWRSNNTEVATVENCMVTAVSVGKATITVTTEDGNRTATCEVVVTDPIPVTGVTLSQTELSLEKGETADLTATVSPADATNQKVTWSSNNTTVATVENGKVTAVSGGKANISVTTEDGNHTATCEVTVTVPVTGVTLSQTELPLVKGTTATLTATVSPTDATNKKVIWSSNNSSVATVENGTVIAVSGGNATITVTTEDGNHLATCEVVVTDLVPVTGVTLSQTELSLEKGETADLTATVSPADATNQKVTWSSNNTTVATVENGKVTAVSGGKATISVTTEDGNHTATCEVTVTEEDVVLTGLQLSPSETRLKVGGEATLSVSYEPAGASQRGVTWSTSDAAIVTVDANGKIKGIAVGEAIITVESKTNTSIKATCKVTVEAATAVADAVFASVVISPNPFGAQLRIVNGDSRGQYVLYNVQGVVVASGVLEASETRINTASFSAGTYLLRLTAENGATKTLTVVKD